MNRIEWLLFLLLPLLVFPFFLFVASLIDWLIGDAKMIMQLSYGSRTQLLIALLRGWITSIPVSALVIWIIYLPTYVFLGAKGLGHWLRPVLAGLLIGFLVGIVIYHFDFTGILIAGMTGLLIGACLSLLERIASRWK